MSRGIVQIYCGDGKGKTNAAIGCGIRAAGQGKSVIVIQFLKGKNTDELSFLKRLEPEIKVFRFEKSEDFFDKLPEEVKEEEIMNIRNGMNFSKKVLVTGECNVLILDEILGLLDKEIISKEELINIIKAKDNDTDLILTGIRYGDEICQYADEVSKIETIRSAEVTVHSRNGR